jgi:hypothetical protein
VRTRRKVARHALGRRWWQCGLRTFLVAAPLLGLLLVVVLESDPYRWKARQHDVAVLMHTRNAQSNREWALSRPEYAPDCLLFARQALAQVAYHQAMSRKYWRLAARPWAWLSVPPDPPPPP